MVDAMERDMGTTIATKADLQILKQDLTLSINDLRNEIGLVRKDMEIMSSTLTIRLGSMMVLGLGLLFAALKLT